MWLLRGGRGQRLAVAAAIGAVGAGVASIAPPHAIASSSPWSVTTPSPDNGQGDNILRGVSCPSATSCQAVGNYTNSSNVSQTLSVGWDGTTWSVTPSANTGTGNNYLFAVSCVLANSCEAVGSYFNGGLIDRTLIESWNGTKWSVVASPNVGTKDNSLSGVSCVKASSCMAVGSSQIAPGVLRTLAESWNGAKWSVVPSPDNGTSSNDLNDVSCPSAGQCIAVGSYFNNSLGATRTLVETWNGTTWSVVPSPDTGTGNNELSGVSCGTATSCMAAGSYFNGLVHSALIESWSGAKWSVVPSPNKGTHSNVLNEVFCVSSAPCRVVGYYDTSKVAQTLIEAWNGTAWVIVPSPDNGLGNNVLNDVSCFSTTSCKAVGYYDNTSSGVEQTLIESRA